MVPAFVTTVLFALSAVSGGRTARLLGGVEANFLRITLATAMLAAWAHLAGQGLSGHAFPVFLISGAIGFGLGDAALYQALPRLGSRLSIMLVHCLAAPFAALTEWLWMGTTLSWQETTASLVILAGVAVALAPGEHLKIPRRALMIGILCGIAAAIGQGGGAVVSRKAYAVARHAGEHVDGLTAAYQRILAGWVVNAGLIFLSFWKWRVSAPAGEHFLAVREKWRAALPWLAFNALAGPSIGVGFYQWALATTPAGVVLPIVATTPLAIIPLARWIEGEKASARSLMGGLIAVAGAVALAIAR